MLTTTLFTISSGASGCIMYFVIKDLYNIYVVKKGLKVVRFNTYTFLNPGTFVGGALGALRGYYGVPVLDLLKSRL